MSNFKVLAGDFAPRDGFTDAGTIALFEPASRNRFPDVRVPRAEIVGVERASPQGMGAGGRAATGAAVGWVVGGELGLIGGTVIATRPQDVTFLCTLRDGRRFVAAGSQDTFAAFVADAQRNRTR